MAGRDLVEVGTRGTVGSLVKREIEYFTRLELEIVQSCMNSERNSEEMAPRLGNFCPGFRFLMVPWRKKKRSNSGIGLPICSVVEVADSQGLNEITRFSYGNCRGASKKFEG